MSKNVKIPFMLSLLPYACFLGGAFMAHRKHSGLGKIFLYGFGGFMLGIIPIVVYMKSNKAKVLTNFQERYTIKEAINIYDEKVSKLSNDEKIKQLIAYAKKYNMLTDETQQKAFRKWVDTLGEKELNFMTKLSIFIDENQDLDMKDKEKTKKAFEKYDIDFNDFRTKQCSDKILKSEFGYIFGG